MEYTGDIKPWWTGQFADPWNRVIPEQGK